MEVLRKFLVLLTLVVLVQSRPWDWPIFGSSTSTSTTSKPAAWTNETIFGVCEDDDKVRS
jgi:hypothetical protein